MRPRISKREAKFVLESLKRDKADVEKKLERLKFLETEIARIRNLIHSHSFYDVVPNNYGDMKEELEQLTAESESLRLYLQVYVSLTAKYEQLASGKKQKGRYTVKADSADIWLSILGY